MSLFKQGVRCSSLHLRNSASNIPAKTSPFYYLVADCFAFDRRRLKICICEKIRWLWLRACELRSCLLVNGGRFDFPALS